MRLWVMAALPLCLAGCGSAPAHFYALSPTDPPGSGAACPAPPLAVRRVLLPDVLDRQAIVRAGPGEQIEVSGRDRWAAPLDRMTQRVLAADLRARLRGRTVLMPGDPVPPGGAEALEVDATRFMPDADGTVALDADWTLLGVDGKPVETRTARVTATGADAAAAMSDALGRLADRVAETGLCPAPRWRRAPPRPA